MTGDPGAFRPRPGSVHERYVQDRLAEVGRWGDEPLGAVVRRHARTIPDRDAFISESERMTWAEYDSWADQIAAGIATAGVVPGDRVAVLLPDGPVIHAAFIGVERAGAIIVGIGPRAGTAEIRHLVQATGASALLSLAQHRAIDVLELVADLQLDGLALRHFVLTRNGTGLTVDIGRVGFRPREVPAANRALGVGDVWLVNSTSGTTGMPKCVVHNQNRWLYYHTLALDAGRFTPDDVVMSLIPAPFGFGIWTAQVTPLLLGAPTVVMERFTADGALELIERERVTVLCCVTTQFVMMLTSPSFADHDLSSLRCMFTGGEAIPYERSVEFEERTGAKVLQFYGSNETGALSYVSLRDDHEHRHGTAGRIIDEMNVRLFDESGNDVTDQGGPGQAACAGPATCLGYLGDEQANEALFTEDGWMLTGDICIIEDDCLTLVGRQSDFIIRGGKNISAAAIEQEIVTHPAVRVAAAVPMSDPVFGERVCVFVKLHADRSMTLPDLLEHLEERGVTKETWPERLEVVHELPRASGGKIAKAQLKRLIEERLLAELSYEIDS